ncbi:hypothetical protein B5807_02675 [Epicoccum nigrum]|uniref:Uncharacterized protein n=1 Tax=Epicoccum nigrum TaxID=105696 RepID=A0A1Y2MD00_EPING|nr:hypothetical protein B5807_02675 [Epicoccum nigrum]
MGTSESILRDPTAKTQAERKMPKPQSRHSDNPKQHDYSSPGVTAHETRKASKPQPQTRPFSSPSQDASDSHIAAAREKHKMPKPRSRSFKSLMKQHVYSSLKATVRAERKTSKLQSRPFNSVHQHVQTRVNKTKKEKKKNKKEKTTPPRRPSAPGTQPGGRESSPIILESDGEATPHSGFADDGVELKLGDISDLKLRKKTAQLMAIAPGLPVADLYHLLVGKEGRFDVAKENVIRVSQTLFNSTSLPVREKTIPPADSVPEGDEVKVKIDFDDEFFIYDAECPETYLPDLRRPKQHSHPKRGEKGLQKPALKPRKGLVTKKTTNESGEYTGDINRGIRETSHDREFIASDDEVPLDDSDADYSDSDQSAATDTSSSESDIDMAIDDEPEYAESDSTEMVSEMGTDEDENLEIDMQPEYAYNSDILLNLNPG